MKIKLGQLLYSFFEDYLKVQKGLQSTSIKSYRDTLRLFLQFVSSKAHHKITRLTSPDLSYKYVLDFLKFLEKERGNHIHTRNQRLAALHTFYIFLANKMPEMLLDAEQVAAIPKKRVSPSETYFLEQDEINQIFTNLPADSCFTLRDKTLLLFLYNTGARVQEVAELRVSNLVLKSPAKVHLHGKGNKWRVCPLWKQTTLLLNQLLETQSNSIDHPVFISSNGKALTRFGIYKIVKRHTEFLHKKRNDGSALKISPHTFRHTTAVHLLESGVEINVIRGWLGHVSLDTTNRYAEINIHMKEKAARVCSAPTTLGECHQKPVWHEDASLLNWLESL
ncbi:MAG TPA: hypothetical protein DEG23_04340 [Coxiellaceae bacterium]|nr:hypothetical protein [Coxiellaceae bacterium]HBY56026.1 hypothetical protein [Coxiellaceae bacterium]